MVEVVEQDTIQENHQVMVGILEDTELPKQVQLIHQLEPQVVKVVTLIVMPEKVVAPVEAEAAEWEELL